MLAVAAVAAATAGARTTASLNLTFVAIDEDRVSVGSSALPGDGPDGHFRLVVDAAGETIVAIELSSTLPDGSLCCGAHWDTVPRGWWALGVFRDGTMLNAGDVGVSDPVVGAQTYELYAQNTGLFKSGQSFRIDVTFASGAAVAVVMTIGTPGSQPITPIAPMTPPISTTPTPTTPSPTTPAPLTPPPAAPGITLTASAPSARAGGCVTLRSSVAAKPAGSTVVLERRVGAAWAAIRSPRACSAKAVRIVYRATLMSATKVVARSKPLTITWKS